MERREGLCRCRENMQLLQVFPSFGDEWSDRIRFSSCSASFFLSKITNNCFILMYKNLCYSGEKTLVSIYVVGIIFITDYKIYKCLQIFHLLSIKKFKSSPKFFANWYCMDIWFSCTVSCVKHKCRVFRLQCAQC